MATVPGLFRSPRDAFSSLFVSSIRRMLLAKVSVLLCNIEIILLIPVSLRSRKFAVIAHIF
jgi:hypothetical protein